MTPKQGCGVTRAAGEFTWCGWAVTIAALTAATPVAAEVLTIGDDGGLQRQDGPALYLTPDLAPAPIESSPRRVSAGPQANDVASAIDQEARRRAISPALVAAIAWRESRFNAAAVSPKGARGVMQLMPATARSLGVDPADPVANVAGGTAYLSGLMARYDGDLVKSLAAYNAGPGAVDRWHGVPPYAETRAYVAAILDRLAAQAE
jgi:soluble lytic murein transglycosylase-like protein